MWMPRYTGVVVFESQRYPDDPGFTRAFTAAEGETSLRERLHGELDGRIVYDRRRVPFGSARLSIGRLARR